MTSGHQPDTMTTTTPTVSATRGALLSTLVNLWPYIWPAERGDLKRRVLWSMLLLLLAKLATMAVPFTFKWATDALAGQGRRRSQHPIGCSGRSPRRSC